MQEAKSRKGVVEAYCLMEYQCRECGTKEILWNSRDGVTPYIISCSQCETGKMSHINWERDIRDTLYVPKVGQRIFIDLTEARAREIAHKIIERSKNTKYAIVEKDKEKFIQNYIKKLNPGEPDIVTVTTEMQRNFIEKYNKAIAARLEQLAAIILWNEDEPARWLDSHVDDISFYDPVSEKPKDDFAPPIPKGEVTIGAQSQCLYNHNRGKLMSQMVRAVRR